jgi:hypothetical protein
MKKITSMEFVSVFKDFDPIIRTMVRKFYGRRRSVYQKIGKDRDDVYGTALELFIKAYLTHDPDRGAFPARARYVIWNGMLDRFNVEYTDAKKRRVLESESGDGPGLDCLPKRTAADFKISDLRAVVSSVSVIAIQLALYPPECIVRKAEASGGSGRNYAAAIKKYMIRKHGLTPHEVRESFREISTYLKEMSE